MKKKQAKTPTRDLKKKPNFHIPEKYSLAALIACTLLVALAQFLLKNGSSQMEFSLQGTLLNVYLMTGLFLYLINAFLFLMILKNLDLSIAQPTMSLSFIWVFLVSYLYLHEKLNVMAIIGIGFIIFGVSFLGRRSR